MTSKVYLIEDKAQKKQLRIRQFGMLANRFIFFLSYCSYWVSLLHF